MGDEMKDLLVPSSESQTYVSLYNIGFDTIDNPQVAAPELEPTAAEPMQNFGELSEFMEVVMAGPEQAPAWLKDFDTKPIGITVKFKTKPEHRNKFVKAMERHREVQDEARSLTIQEDGVVAVPHFRLHTSPF